MLPSFSCKTYGNDNFFFFLFFSFNNLWRFFDFLFVWVECKGSGRGSDKIRSFAFVFNIYRNLLSLSKSILATFFVKKRWTWVRSYVFAIAEFIIVNNTANSKSFSFTITSLPISWRKSKTKTTLTYSLWKYSKYRRGSLYL